MVAYIINLSISCGRPPNNWSYAIKTPVRELSIRHEHKRHRIYRDKEAAYWNRQFTNQSAQPKKL